MHRQNKLKCLSLVGFWASLIFDSKAGAFISGAPFSATLKYQTSLKIFVWINASAYLMGVTETKKKSYITLNHGTCVIKLFRALSNYDS
jgi:hypothetical protein